MHYKDHIPQKYYFQNLYSFTFINKIHKSSGYKSNETVQTQGTDKKLNMGATETLVCFYSPAVMYWNYDCMTIFSTCFLICYGQHYIEIIVRANTIVQLQVLSIGKVKSLLLLSKCHLSKTHQQILIKNLKHFNELLCQSEFFYDVSKLL